MGAPSCPHTATIPKPAMVRDTATLSTTVSFFMGLSLWIWKTGMDLLQYYITRHGLVLSEESRNKLGKACIKYLGFVQINGRK